MDKAPEPIHIRIIQREGKLIGTEDVRYSFWAPLKETDQFSNIQIAQLEAKLCREFGIELRNTLVGHFLEIFQKIENEIFPGNLRDYEKYFFHYLGDFPDRRKESYSYQFAEVFGKILDHRHELLRESSELRFVQERIAATAGIVFAVRISGYGSMGLELSVGSFRQVAKVFEGNFETFRIFLDVFIPIAFADVFDEDFADLFNYKVNIPLSTREAFERAASTNREEISPSPVSAPGQQRIPQPQPSARERAEWIWRLANGSLLIPFIIALLVMYYGLRMLSEFQKTQYEILKPIMQHQLELLKEDRQRLTGPNDSEFRIANEMPNDSL